MRAGASQNRVRRTIHEAASLLEELEVEYAVTGVAAAAIYDFTRATKGVDFVLAVDEDEWEGVVKTFIKRGYRFRRENFHKLGMTALWSPAGFGVDLFMEDDAEVFERAVGVNYYGKKIPFVSLEDLTRQKLRFGRDKDVLDLVALLRMNEERIDWGYIKEKLDDEEFEKLDKLRRVARGELEVTAVFGRRSGKRKQ